MIDLFPLLKPLIFMRDAEAAHMMTIRLLKAGLSPVFFKGSDDPILKTTVFGLSFENPVGLAAGFDKNAEVMQPILNAGFGFTEAGTVTPFPQEGNPLPRLFRLKKDEAVINRFGFNNEGLSYYIDQFEAFNKKKRGGIVGANIGANKEAEDRTADYVTCLERLYGLSDYFTVNISSPNTPGLRALQSKEALEDLVNRLIIARKQAMSGKKGYIPILVKIAPDLLQQDKEDIADIALNSDIDGLIISNTTIERFETLRSQDKEEIGGLSGKPVFEKSTQALYDLYKLTEGKVPLIGVGGISSGADAYEKIKAGASLVQLYSMLVYKGPGLVTQIKRDLTKLLKKDGYTAVSEAVGAAHR
ncbi:quinone-dependent dihydroorotate dehydrogenase [Temperatibacter marinus]|uniref:Dihydroorotate dehydrogenase (quinone) n=1 Tax=Temperatibacter marinus TaxID=1456591 RepID=A0AA52EFC1_9PROT|nr:quinone-dependent dihydroorotate dehydrogenase [Temperatibacter marinus]WND03690.1 quinone-dependent dihydroorotate dehydrogenase [Temperatibacter marinus]